MTSLEGVLDHPDVDTAHRRNVEADLAGITVRRGQRQPACCQASDPQLLLAGHGFKWRAELRTAPRLDLAHDERRPLPDDEVELTLPASPVASQDRVTPLAIPPGDCVLSRRAQLLPRVDQS